MSQQIKSFCGVLSNIHPGKCNRSEWANIRIQSSKICHECTSDSFNNYLVLLTQTLGHITPGSCNCSEWHSIRRKCNTLLTQFNKRDTYEIFKDLLCHLTTIYPGKCNCSEWSSIRSSATATLAAMALLIQQNKENQLKKEMEQQKKQLKSSLIQQKDQLESQKQYIITQELNPMNIQKDAIETKISGEEKSIQGMTLERNDKTKKIIICVGKTGHGKSTFVNRLSGDISLMARSGPCKTSIGYKSCTQSLQKVNNGKLCIIDCPGWADAGGADREHSNNLCKFLKGCGGINAFVLIRNATQYRFDADFQEKLRHLGDTFGDKFWNNLIIVLTHVDKGMAEAQFIQGNKAEELQKRVAKLCNKNIIVPVLPFGLDNYKDKLKVFVNTIPNNRFICDKIKSPIDTLKADKKSIVDKLNQTQRKIDKINDEIKKVQDEINSLLI